ncbi:MAG: NYN domain-containing protein [Candidatus Omnitrophota bacterium]
MQHLILDGYNVIHKIPQLAKCLEESLQAAREAAANYMLTWKRTRGFSGKVSIVFDGKDIFSDTGEAPGGIAFIYTAQKHGADDHIISMVKRAQQPEKIIVITSDNYVTNNCRAHGATVKPVDFLLLPAKVKGGQHEKIIDDKTADEINAFLKKRWGIRS